MSVTHPGTAVPDLPRRMRCHPDASSPRESHAQDPVLRSWVEGHDITAAARLAARYRGLVLDLAEHYRDLGVPWEDLTGEANQGLMRAICRFTIGSQTNFETQAAWSIVASLDAVVRARLAQLRPSSTQEEGTA